MNVLEFGKVVGKLKKIKRTGWVRSGVSEPESVAEHELRLATLALVTAHDLNVNQEKIVRMALIHDIAEAEVGDIVIDRGGIVRGSSEKHLKERQAIEYIFGGLNDSDELIALWDEYEHQESKEAKILKQLDRLEMVMSALEYEETINKSSELNEFWESARKTIQEPLIVEWFNKLESERKILVKEKSKK
jgi:putative hydrolase of HD superfamily